MIVKKLDIAFLIKSISELEKLKLLLFDEDQYHLFEKIPKPYLVDARTKLYKSKKSSLEGSHPSSRNVDEEASEPGKRSENDKLSDEEDPNQPKRDKKGEEGGEKDFDPVFISSSTFWNKSKITNEEEMQRFSRALDNIRSKEEKGNLNPIDKRLMKILKLYRKDSEAPAN